jgi:hypothetical protein
MATREHALSHGTDRTPATEQLEPAVEPEAGTGTRATPLGGLSTARRAASAASADPLGGTAAAPEVVAALQRRKGAGQPLPSDVANRFGEQLGTDLAGVRVHHDTEADQVARSVQATAFTHGTDIYFTAGAYAPGTGSGQHLLAHELAHVAQQRAGTGGSTSGTVIGRADDPAEREADAMASGVVSALQRRASTVQAGAERASSAGPTTQDAHIHRWPFGKKKGADAGGTPAVDKRTAKKRFEDLLSSKKPKDADEAAARMGSLRAMLTALTPEERETISTDPKLMKKARRFIGNHEYMSLVAAVGMSYKPPAKGKKKGAPAPVGPQHMSGLEADVFIQTNMGKIAHLKPFLDTAIGAGKKADGFVATVGDEDWELIYKTQNPDEDFDDDEQRTTNAFIANEHTDRPAIIHAERGTRSTAIHESMHRYSELTVLRTYGFRLNEGMTEYFTRLITDRDGNPVNGGVSNRDNYDDNWAFVCNLLGMLGGDLVAQQTELAEIYFNGDAARLKTHFEAGCAAANLSAEDTATRWTDFIAAIKGGDWDEAVAKLPPPPAPPAPAPVAPPAPADVGPPAPVDGGPPAPVVPAPPTPVGAGVGG